MDIKEDHPAFGSGEELRQAAEIRFGRPLTPEEWKIIDPEDWPALAASFDETDLDELLEAMARLPAPPKPSTNERRRAQALYSRYRTAAEAKEFVERHRVRLFGKPDPPFKDNLAAAAHWIESQPAPRNAFLLTLCVVCPVRRDGLHHLIWLRDWLIDALPGAAPDDPSERRGILKRLLTMESGPLRSIGHLNPLLDYLAPHASGKLEIRRVPTDDGTILDRVRRSAEALARVTLWSKVASVHHILTGGVTSAPVTATSHNRWGIESFGGPAITLEILDPFGVSAGQVARAYTEARKGIIGPHLIPRKRARRSAKSEQLAALVQETPTLTWAQQWTIWNHRYPAQRFPTPDAMRQAYYRARRA
jgi:hypothetical protein